jgi:SAM-dependent methyltransferase
MIVTTQPQRRPNTARIYDYWLGGTHHFPEDAEHGERMKQVLPDIAEISLANRAYLRRAVRVLAEAGIDQFLDLGSGLPSEGNVHETARLVNPHARTVYVDIDPVTVEFGRAMLIGTDGVAILTADLRDVPSVLESDEVAACLDLDRPLGLLMVAMLQFVPDQDDPARVVAAYRDACAPGSYLVVSHATSEFHAAKVRAAAQVYNAATLPITMRSRAQIESLLAGYELLEPGLVEPVNWRPQPGDYNPFQDEPSRYDMLAGVGRLS